MKSCITQDFQHWGWQYITDESTQADAAGEKPRGHTGAVAYNVGTKDLFNVHFFLGRTPLTLFCEKSLQRVINQGACAVRVLPEVLVYSGEMQVLVYRVHSS